MQAWIDFLKTLEPRFGKNTIDAWLRSIHVSKFDHENIYLEFSDDFQKEWFLEHIAKLASASLKNAKGSSIKIHLSGGRARQKRKRKPLKTPFTVDTDPLDTTLLFDTFLPTKDTLIPLQILAAQSGYNLDSNSFSNLPPSSEVISPILVVGAPSSGKTHLLQALCHIFAEQGLKALYTKTETFTLNTVKAMRENHMHAFRKFYRDLDVLILDDIETLERKTATQEEFFHTFNHLYSCGKRIILSARTYPKNFKHIEERLISRFEWGMALTINPLDSSSLKLFLTHKERKLKLDLPKEVREYLLQTYQSTKSLSQAIEVLHFKKNIDQARGFHLDLAQVKNLLEKTRITCSSKELSSSHILKAVSAITNIPTEDIIGKSRALDIAFARKISIYLIRQKLKLPYMKIGDIFQKDHSTIISSQKTIENQVRDKDPKTLEVLEKVSLEI